LFEKIELLEWLKSVNGKDEIIWGRLSKTGHEILNLNVIEDHGGDVMGVLLSHGFVWSGLNGGEEIRGIGLDGGSDLGGELSGVIVSLGLRVRDSEWEILRDLVEIGFDGSKSLWLWVLEGLSSFRSGGFMSSNILIRDGIGSNIRKGRDVLIWVWVVVVSHGREGSTFRAGNEEGNNGRCQEFHYLI
jgi:hypothetical protein